MKSLGARTDNPHDRSAALWAKARQVIPGGVNSPVRSFASVGGLPRFFARGRGPYLWDVDGKRYVDYVLSWGAMLLGHAHPRVVEAICGAAERGTSYGACTEAEVELAELLVQSFPAVEMVRLVNSGTEATMSAIRIARAFTGRDKVVKFAGAYHGHADSFLVKAGSGVMTLGMADSPGVPEAVAADTIVVPYNDTSALHRAFERYKEKIAAVIAEPIMANMGFIRPRDGFLAEVQALCREHSALFVLDEVITGMRVDLRSAQGLWGLDPDLTCMGKVIGGGMPLAAYGGKEAVMRWVAPSGPVYQAGTLAGNPLAASAGVATILTLREEGLFSQAVDRTTRLAQGVRELAAKHGLAVQVDHEGTIFGVFFLTDSQGSIRDHVSAKKYADTKKYSRFFRGMLEKGFFLAPSQFEVGFLSTGHDDRIIAQTLEATDEVFSWLVKGG